MVFMDFRIFPGFGGVLQACVYDFMGFEGVLKVFRRVSSRVQVVGSGVVWRFWGFRSV